MNDARALTRTEPQPHGGLPIIAMRSFDGRVGGTLLMQLLGTSEAVVIDRVYPFENRYLTYLVHFARQLGTAAEPSRHWTMQDMLRDTFSNELAKGGPLPFEPLSIDRADFERRALAGLWVAFSDAARARGGQGLRYYAEKVPLDMQGLVDAGLDAVVIDLVRDPRDVFASIQAFNSARAYLGFGRRADQSASEYLETQVENWKRRIEVMRIPIAGARTILIRYEDMVADLAGVAAHLGGLLSISMDASRVEADRERYTQHMTSDGGAGSVGRWRRDLSAAESGRIERTLGDELAHFGYR